MIEPSPSARPRKRGRPRKDPDLAGSPKAALIRVGVSVLTEKGFSAASVDEILAKAGMPKGSFYHYFSGKDAFGLALIDAYADYFARKLDRWFADTATPPLRRLDNFIADARAGMQRHAFRRGCLIGTLGQEMGALPEPFRDRLSTVFRDWEARTAACLRAAQEAGDIPADADCDRLAAFFWIGWEGAVLRAKLERSPAALDAFASGFTALLGTAPHSIPKRNDQNQDHPMSNDHLPISRFPVPALADMPEDIRQRILAVQEKSGFIPNVFLALAHRPDEFRAFFAYHDALMDKPGNLTKAEREMIVVATSTLNQCQYCVVAHGAILRIRAKNPLIADQVAINYRKADITDRQKAMIDFAIRVSVKAYKIGDDDMEALKGHGFTEDDIWDIAAISAFFGMSNRLANVSSIRPNAEFYSLGR